MSQRDVSVLVAPQRIGVLLGGRAPPPKRGYAGTMAATTYRRQKAGCPRIGVGGLREDESSLAHAVQKAKMAAR